MRLILAARIPANNMLPLRLLLRRTKVTLSRDGTCFVARHPETEHPYGQTLPMPKQTQRNPESILRVDSKDMFTKSPNLEQVQALTYTPASYWRQTPGKDKRDAYKASFDDKEPGKF